MIVHRSSPDKEASARHMARLSDVWISGSRIRRGAAAARLRQAAVLRERGISLLETAFAIAVFAALVAMIAIFVGQEQRRQADMLAAREFARFLEAAQIHAAGGRQAILEDLVQAASETSSSAAVIEIGVDDLVASGALSPVFAGDGPAAEPVNLFGQSYLVLVRGVWRTTEEGETEAGTLTGSMIADELAREGSDENEDGVPDRMSFEAVLVTVGGKPIAANRGGPIASRVGGDAGYVLRADSKALGPYGSWELDLGAYDELEDYPLDPALRQGRLAGLVALPGERQFGGLSFSGGAGGADLSQYFARVNIPGRDNTVEVNLEFKNGDSSILNKDGSPVRIRNIFVGAAEEPGTIVNAGSISCLPTPGADPVDADEFHILCGQTFVHGDVTVAGDTQVNRDLTVEGDISAKNDITVEGDAAVRGAASVDGNATFNNAVSVENNLTINSGNLIISSGYGKGEDFVLPDGHSLSQTPREIVIVPNGAVIDKPSCPAIDVDGEPVQLQPGIYASVAASVDELGVPLVGVVARAEDNPLSPATSWRVVLTNYINEEGAEDTSVGYDVAPEWGRILVVTRCYAPA